MMLARFFKDHRSEMPSSLPIFGLLLAVPFAAVLLCAQSPPTSLDEQSSSAPVQNAGPPPVPAFHANVNLVNVFFSVRARKGGQLIPNLTRQDFKVYEDGIEQKILQFSRETDLPLTLGLLIDVSASQDRLVDIEREAASQFFSSVIRQKDEAFLISFGKETTLLQDYTNSARRLIGAMQGLQGDGPGGIMTGGPIPNTGPVPQVGSPKGTLLYDAVYLACNDKLKGQPGRKAVILITDGDDQGSYYKLDQAIEAAQRADTIIYSIYYVDRGFYMQAGYIGGGEGASVLDKMSRETGGHMFRVSRKHPLNEAFKQIQDEMRNQYSLGYKSTNEKRDGTFRRIKITTDDSAYRVQARSGYYATPSGEQ